MTTNTNLETRIAIRISKEDYDLINNLSNAKGISMAGLVRMWMKEKLQEHKQSDQFAIIASNGEK